MLRVRLVLGLLTCLILAGLVAAQEPAVDAALAVVEKVSRTKLTILPRGSGGRFEKSLTLRLTGTTNFSRVSWQKRAGQLVPVQTNIRATDLKAKQAIAVIYASGPGTPVLLSAVVHPAAER